MQRVFLVGVVMAVTAAGVGACRDVQHRKLDACCAQVRAGAPNAEALRLCAARPPRDTEGTDQVRTHVRQAYQVNHAAVPAACVRTEDTEAIALPERRGP